VAPFEDNGNKEPGANKGWFINNNKCGMTMDLPFTFFTEQNELNRSSIKINKSQHNVNNK